MEEVWSSHPQRLVQAHRRLETSETEMSTTPWRGVVCNVQLCYSERDTLPFNKCLTNDRNEHEILLIMPATIISDGKRGSCSSVNFGGDPIIVDWSVNAGV